MAVNARSAFTPNTAATVTTSVTNSNTATALVGGGSTVVVTNSPSSAAIAFIELGTSAAVAVATTGMPVPPGAILVLSRPPGCTHIAAITASSTATLYTTTGDGD